MATINDELMRDMARTVGAAYAKHKAALGDADTPGTLTYELNDLVAFANGDLPKEGVLTGLAVTIGTDTSTVDVASGQILSNRVPMTVDATNVSVARTFMDSYAANYQYGFVVAIPRADVTSSATSSRSKLSTALTADSSTQVVIADPALLDDYAPPFFIAVGAEMIEIWAVDADGNALISPAYNSGKADANHLANVPVFITKKVIPQVICGLPVSPTYQTGGDPATFAYHPPVSEKEYVLLARGLVTKPNTVAVSRTPEVVAVEDLRVLQDQPGTDMFSVTEAAQIERSAEQVRQLVEASAGGSSPQVILAAMIPLVPEGTGSFADYWNDRPFVASSNFLRGESHFGLSRFEFDEDFKTLYWDYYGSDLLNTFAIFRGDIFDGQQTYGSPPADLTGTFEPQATALLGNLSDGTWSYRVTTVTSSGESSPSSCVTISIPPSSGPHNKTMLTWTKDADALYYHVYRISSINDRMYEVRITAASEVVNGGGSTVTFEDDGSVVGASVRRGVKLTGRTLHEAKQLYAYVPQVSGQLGTFMGGDMNAAYLSDERTQNEMIVSITGIKADGTLGGPHEVTIPQYSERGYKAAFGTVSDRYVGVADVTVSAGASLNLQGGRVVWSPYDLVTIQNV